MVGSADPSEHRKDPDPSNLVQRVHILTAENEERRTHLVRIMDRSKSICSGLKSLPSHLPTL